MSAGSHGLDRPHGFSPPVLSRAIGKYSLGRQSGNSVYMYINLRHHEIKNTGQTVQMSLLNCAFFVDLHVTESQQALQSLSKEVIYNRHCQSKIFFNYCNSQNFVKRPYTTGHILALIIAA